MVQLLEAQQLKFNLKTLSECWDKFDRLNEEKVAQWVEGFEQELREKLAKGDFTSYEYDLIKEILGE